jgi:hypothetical protein
MTHYAKQKNNLLPTGQKAVRKKSILQPVHNRYSRFKEIKTELYSEEEYLLNLQSRLPH